MKVHIFFLLIVLVLVCLTYRLPAKETFTIKIDKSNVTLLDSNLYSNCGSKFESKMTVDGTKFIITQIDTSTQKMRCNCYFDISHNIWEVKSGIHQIEIWRQDSPVSIAFLVFSSEFVVNWGTEMPPITILESSQSDCKGRTDIEDYESISSNQVEIFPSPASVNPSVSFVMPFDGNVDLFIYNIYGLKFIESKFCSLRRGKQVLNLDCSGFIPGFYTGKIVFSNNEIKSFKFIFAD